MSSQSLQRTQRNSMSSKAELKIALIAKRLAMLQDDNIHPVSVERSVHYQSGSESRKVSKENRFSKLRVSRDSMPEEYYASSPVKDVVEDMSTDDVIPVSKANQRKYRRRSLIVISEDESEEDGNLQLLVRPLKKERIRRKRVYSNSCLNNESHNALDKPKNKRITKREKVDSNYCLNNESHCALDKAQNKRIKIVEAKDYSPSTVMKRAKEVQANLPAEYPSFVKLMSVSHVTRVFWLHLPSSFCKDHLPKSDCILYLVDEDGNKSKCNYIAEKTAFGGGWRGFSLEHGLNEGDVVVFQLIAFTTFKVYIIRTEGLDEFEGALGLLTLDGCKGQEISEKRNGDSQMVLIPEDSPPLNSESPRNSSDHVGFEALDGICFSNAAINFEAIEGFDNFRIVVDGLVIDSKFSDVHRKKYYELCCDQNSFLHEQLLKGLNCNLSIGIILETINIADAIRTCRTSSTSIKYFQIWEKTLKGFEVLGMKVAFLRAELSQMLGTASDLDIIDESNELEKCIAERDTASQKMRALERKLGKLKGTMENINLEIEAEMTASTKKLQSKLKEITNAPW